MQGNNRIGHCDTFHLGRLCGPELRNGTGFFSGARFSGALSGMGRNSARAHVPGQAGCEKKRAATVEVLVWYAASRREASRLRAPMSAGFRRSVGDVRRSSFGEGGLFASDR